VRPNRTSVGLDVHARSVVACGLDGQTGELFERRLTPDHLHSRPAGTGWGCCGVGRAPSTPTGRLLLRSRRVSPTVPAGFKPFEDHGFRRALLGPPLSRDARDRRGLAGEDVDRDPNVAPPLPRYAPRLLP
jgi:hypothetical protein